MSSPRSTTRMLAVTAAAAVALALSAGTAAAGPTKAKPGKKAKSTQIQLLSFNDLHGNLEPPSGSGGRVTTGYTETRSAAGPFVATPTNVDAGGVEYLATHLNNARAGNPNSVTVAAGDLIGASPLLSAAFHDEPTIESMNALGLEATAVGNHEFDEGYTELLRMDAGGCLDDGDGKDNQNSCADHTFEGAKFAMLAANVRFTDSGKTILPSTWTKTFADGAKVGFIGMTLKETPAIVSQAGIKGLTFTDEVATANALVPGLRKQGVKAIVVLVHQGAVPTPSTLTGANGTYSVTPPYDATCSTETKNGVSGAQLRGDSPVLNIAKGLDPQIDMVVSGHTHQPYVCSVPDPEGVDRLVTSASSFGRLFTETTMTYNLRSGDIERSSVTGSNMVVTRNVAKDAAQTSIINIYKPLVATISNRVIGTITTDSLPATSAADPETSLGRLIADAQLADPSVVSGGRAPQIAFMNPGGIRGSLASTGGTVTYGQAFAVQPFNNFVVSMDLTGQQVLDLLNQQFTGPNASFTKLLQVSRGFTYTYSASTKAVSDVKLDGVAINPAATYRVAANSFLSDGGDGFAAFATGTNKLIGGLDIDAFAAYLTASSPYTPIATDRITITP